MNYPQYPCLSGALFTFLDVLYDSCVKAFFFPEDLGVPISVLQIRRVMEDNQDNSKIIFLISQGNFMLGHGKTVLMMGTNI